MTTVLMQTVRWSSIFQLEHQPTNTTTYFDRQSGGIIKNIFVQIIIASLALLIMLTCKTKGINITKQKYDLQHHKPINCVCLQCLHANHITVYTGFIQNLVTRPSWEAMCSLTIVFSLQINTSTYIQGYLHTLYNYITWITFKDFIIESTRCNSLKQLLTLMCYCFVTPLGWFCGLKLICF